MLAFTTNFMAPFMDDFAYSPASILQTAWTLQMALRERGKEEKYFVAKLSLQYKYLEGYEFLRCLFKSIFNLQAAPKSLHNIPFMELVSLHIKITIFSLVFLFAYTKQTFENKNIVIKLGN